MQQPPGPASSSQPAQPSQGLEEAPVLRGTCTVPVHHLHNLGTAAGKGGINAIRRGTAAFSRFASLRGFAFDFALAALPWQPSEIHASADDDCVGVGV